MKVLNNTHYYNEFTKYYNTFSDSTSFQFESSRRNGYFQRLWFEYEYCKKVGGTAWFYTLTYNDASIPHYLGHPCFSYDDIRYVTNGQLSKVLLRKYGSRLRYFCSCERGEGKGKRGLGNNPHYHFIFFVIPDEKNFSSYRRILPIEFNALIQKIWQGKVGYISYNSARFGIAKPGNNLGEVLSSDCFSYCCKYVCKDVAEVDTVDSISKYWFKICCEQSYSSLCIYNWYLSLRSRNAIKDKYEFYDKFRLGALHLQYKLGHSTPFNFPQWIIKYCSASAQCFVRDLLDWFNTDWKSIFVSDKLREYRNLYSSKPRSSKSLGLYGLKFIKNKDSKPYFEIPSSSGYKVQSPCLYYIRHLYYDVFKCPYTGNNLYRLNDFGREVKLSRLSSDINSFIQRVRDLVSCALINNIKFHVFDNDEDCSLSDAYFYSICNSIDYDEFLRRFAIYKLVYEFRSYKDLFQLDLTEDCLYVDVLNDYSRFLRYDLSLLDFDENSLSNIVYCSQSRGFDISSHPAFVKYKSAFDFMTFVVNDVSDFLSSIKKSDFDKKSCDLKRFNSYRHNVLDSCFDFSPKNSLLC